MFHVGFRGSINSPNGTGISKISTHIEEATISVGAQDAELGNFQWMNRPKIAT